VDIDDPYLILEPGASGGRTDPGDRGPDPAPASVPPSGTLPPPGWAPPEVPEPLLPRWVVGALVLTILVSGLAVAGRVVTIPYDSVGPGSARDVGGVVTVQGHPVYPASGRILYTTVSVRERLNLYEALAGWLDPHVDVIAERDVRGTTPPAQYRQENIDAMADSKTIAQLIVLHYLGYPNAGSGAEVVSVDSKLPVARVLETHDVIVAIDGKPVAMSGDAVALIQAHHPGDRIVLRFERDGKDQDAEGGLVAGDGQRPLLGVRLTTRVKMPFQVEIDSGDVVGPSAGLAYALELLDVLTPGELTGGTTVAATGELGPTGEVGPIGGIRQKAVTVEAAGAKVFLVPRANLADARRAAGTGLDIRPVDNFDDAVRQLASLKGSNALALGRPGAPPA